MVVTLKKSGVNSYSLANEKRYEAWGSVRYDDGVSGSDHVINPKTRYCANLGHSDDSYIGLTYMRARWYDASAGRFISEDRAMQGENWYTYCGNRPIDRSDESGNEFDWDGFRMLVTFSVGVALFFMGLYLLGWADSIRVDVRMLNYAISKFEALKDMAGSFADARVRGLRQLEENIQNRNRLARNSAYLKLLGYSMVLSALIIDIDLAPDSDLDILRLFYGGQ